MSLCVQQAAGCWWSREAQTVTRLESGCFYPVETLNWSCSPGIWPCPHTDPAAVSGGHWSGLWQLKALALAAAVWVMQTPAGMCFCHQHAFCEEQIYRLCSKCRPVSTEEALATSKCIQAIHKYPMYSNVMWNDTLLSDAAVDA